MRRGDGGEVNSRAAGFFVTIRDELCERSSEQPAREVPCFECDECARANVYRAG